jgi:hypothetical protein
MLSPGNLEINAQCKEINGASERVRSSGAFVGRMEPSTFFAAAFFVIFRRSY